MPRSVNRFDKAVVNQDPGLSQIVLEPLFAMLRNDPRWLPFLRKLGKAPEQLTGRLCRLVRAGPFRGPFIAAHAGRSRPGVAQGAARLALPFIARLPLNTLEN